MPAVALEALEASLERMMQDDGGERRLSALDCERFCFAETVSTEVYFFQTSFFLLLRSSQTKTRFRGPVGTRRYRARLLSLLLAARALQSFL